MRAISLMQPWATAIALGLKRVETRDRNLSHRGPLAIHASKTQDEDSLVFFLENRSLFRAGGFLGGYYDLPFGCVVSTCNLAAVWPTDRLWPRLDETERIFGNYLPDRFGYVLEAVRRLEQPVKA
jgi:hypothetical protein